MKNHKEMFEALLAGETLVSSAKGTNEYKMIDDRIHYRNVKEVTAWCKCNGMPHFDAVEVIPKTININGFEVPEPIKGRIEIDEEVYLSRVDMPILYEKLKWANHPGHWLLRDNGLLYKTKEAAITHAKALLSFTKKE